MFTHTSSFFRIYRFIRFITCKSNLKSYAKLHYVLLSWFLKSVFLPSKVFCVKRENNFENISALINIIALWIMLWKSMEENKLLRFSWNLLLWTNLLTEFLETLDLKKHVLCVFRLSSYINFLSGVPCGSHCQCSNVVFALYIETALTNLFYN